MIPKYSIVIPVYNEEVALVSCLTALTRQTTTEPFEVIIANNNSTDNSVAVSEKFKKDLDLRIILAKQQGRGAARSEGFAAARGDIILSTDADTIVPPNWIAELVKPLQNPKIVGTTTFCYIEDCNSFTNVRFNLLQPTISFFYRWYSHHYWLSGFSFAVRKDIYEKSGGFDPTLDAQEDTDLSKRIAKQGKIVVVHSMKVLVSGRRFKNGLTKGLMPYLKTYIARNYLRKKSTYLDSVR